MKARKHLVVQGSYGFTPGIIKNDELRKFIYCDTMSEATQTLQQLKKVMSSSKKIFWALVTNSA
jgi:hypothetical protein